MRVFCLLAFLCPWLSIAQKIKPLSIGDQVPDIVFDHIINAPFSSIKLSHYPDKLVILDFFATSCGSCISALPRLDSLQKRFKDSLIILVTCYEPAKIIRRFLQTNTIAKNNSLVFVTGDTILKKRFPHYLIPHEVWIKKQKVHAITDAETVSASIIQKVLSKKVFMLPIKKDILDFNPAISLRSQMVPDDTALFLHQSLVTNYIDGLGTRRGLQTAEGSKRMYFINWNILSLFQYAWGFAANQIVLEVTEPNLFLDKTTDPVAWRKHNLYCYEGSFPLSCPDSLIRAGLRAGLQSGLPFKGNWEKREMPCYVITREDKGPAISVNSKTTYSKDAKTDSLHLLNHSLGAITSICNEASQPTPGKPIIVNETGIGYPIDLVIPAEALQDPLKLQKALIPYHLSLSYTSRVLDVFVLKDQQPTFTQIK